MSEKMWMAGLLEMKWTQVNEKKDVILLPETEANDALEKLGLPPDHLGEVVVLFVPTVPVLLFDLGLWSVVLLPHQKQNSNQTH